MKTKLSKLMSGVIILLLTGCAGFNNSPYSNELVQTKLSLSQDNYRIVKQVEGEWSARYIFGIGGMKYKTGTSQFRNQFICIIDFSIIYNIVCAE